MWYEKTAMILAAIGAINWGLAELGWNAVSGLLGWAGSTIIMLVYYLIALCGVFALVKAFK